MRPTPWARVALHLANLLVIAFFLLPLIAVTFAALQSEKSLHADTRGLWPPEWTLDNFRVIFSGGAQRGKVFEQATYLPDNIKKFHFALINSTVISVSVTLLTLVFASLTAYTVVRLRSRWVMWLMGVNVFARFVPIIVLMIPLYVTFRQMGLLNSIWGVIIAETGFLLPYGILILVPYFATIPQELDDAARIDGCSRFAAFLRITLPLSTPATGLVWRDRLRHRLERPADPAHPQQPRRVHDAAGDDRQPGRRRVRVLQSDDGDLSGRIGPDGDPGAAAAPVRRAGAVGGRREGLTKSASNVIAGSHRPAEARPATGGHPIAL